MNRRLPGAGPDTLPMIIESILFVAEVAVDVTMLTRALRRPRDAVEEALVVLEKRCTEGGTRLQRNGDYIQLVTAPEYGPYVERFLGMESKQRLSSAALESLAIIAYKQPATRASVEAVRGVNSDGAIASLITRGLVEEVGRAQSPGRPALLGTTLRFLEHFGLSNPSELPPIDGISAETGFQTPLKIVKPLPPIEDDEDEDDLIDEDETEESP